MQREVCRLKGLFESEIMQDMIAHLLVLGDNIRQTIVCVRLNIDELQRREPRNEQYGNTDGHFRHGYLFLSKKIPCNRFHGEEACLVFLQAIASLLN